MNRYTQTAVASLLALSTFAGSAHARSVQANIGKAMYPSDDVCFSGGWYGALANNCNTPRYIQFPLPVDTSGSYWGYVNAYGSSSTNNVGCYAYGFNKETSMWSYGGRLWLTSFGASAGIELGRVYVPDLGTMNVECEVKPGGRVNSVSWGQ